MNDLEISVPRYGEVAGLPVRAIAISNSDRNKLACLKQAWFSLIEGLRPIREHIRLNYGRAWHWYLEARNSWFMENDTPLPVGFIIVCSWCEGGGCSHCDGTGLGPVGLAWSRWRDDVEEDQLTEEDAEKLHLILNRAVEGHIRKYGREPSAKWKVIGVEAQIAVPIRSPSGRPFAPTTYLVERTDGFRLAGTDEIEIAKKVRWPYYQVMTMDAVLQHRQTGVVVVWEGKSSASPTSYMQGISVDPQVAGYCWGLQQMLGKPGPFESINPKSKVVGYIFDVASNKKQSDPRLLKEQKVQAVDESGELMWKGKTKKMKVYQVGEDGKPVLRSPGFSVAKNTGVPSWRFLKALKEQGYSESEYEEHIEHLQMSVDPKLYQWYFGAVNEELHARYAREIYGVAVRIAGLRRKAARLSVGEIEQTFARTPICRLPGGICDYRGPCLEDGDIVRGDFKAREGQRWVRSDTSEKKAVEPSISHPEITW